MIVLNLETEQTLSGSLDTDVATIRYLSALYSQL